MTTCCISRQVFCVVFCGFTIGLVSPVLAETVFFDDFSDGDLQAWRPNQTTAAQVEDDSLVISRSGFAGMFVDGLELGDVSVRSRVRMQQGYLPSTGIGVMVRRSEGGGNYWATITREGKAFFGYSGEETFPGIDTDFDITGEDIMLQLDAIGDVISLWAWPSGESMPSTPLATVEDTRAAVGEVQLWINDPGTSRYVEGAFRFIHVGTTHIPEPSTLGLALLGLLGIAGSCWRPTKQPRCPDKEPRIVC